MTNDQRAIEALRGLVAQRDRISRIDVAWNRAVAALAAVDAQPTEPVQEPVAWAVFVGDERMKVFDTEDDAVRWHRCETGYGSGYSYTVRPLYAHPAQPLTEEQIDKILEQERLRWVSAPPVHEFAMAFARAIERAHGIGGAA